MATLAVEKQFGAFFTPPDVAEILVDWAVRSKSDTILDPSSGDGIFLHASVSRLRALGGRPEQVVGVEINEQHAWSSRRSGARVLVGDFFSKWGTEIDAVDCVVGNPPFIRYQQFKGLARDRAIGVAQSVGVALSELSSSWAPSPWFCPRKRYTLNTHGR
jgi:adenine-specific DNA-methyltransferase